MSLGTVPSERELLEQVADDYRQRGYDVVREPAPGERPSFLGPLVPDVIAKKGRENLVIEVKRTKIPRLSHSLRALLEALRKQPDWRLRLVYLGPEGEFEMFEVPTLTADEAQQKIDSAASMFESDEQVAALLVLWSVLEAVGLNRLADVQGEEIGPMPPIAILKELTSFGLIEQEEFTKLRSILELRNAAAHGRPTIRVANSQFQTLLETVKSLLYWRPVSEGIG